MAFWKTSRSEKNFLLLKSTFSDDKKNRIRSIHSSFVSEEDAAEGGSFLDRIKKIWLKNSIIQ